MAVSGHNGNNETLIGFSTSVGLSFYDENANEIPITQSKTPIDITIQRDVNLPQYSYQYVNASQIQLSPGSFYLPNGFNITSSNSSMHIELKPVNMGIAYFLVMKLGYTPIVNASYADYTSFKLMCPSNFSV